MLQGRVLGVWLRMRVDYAEFGEDRDFLSDFRWKEGLSNVCRKQAAAVVGLMKVEECIWWRVVLMFVPVVLRLANRNRVIVRQHLPDWKSTRNITFIRNITNE